MNGVPPRANTDRSRIAAVGSILVLCLVAAPTMALFPIGVWNIQRALSLSGVSLGALVLTPVAVGGILIMWSLARRWLARTGFAYATATAALVVGTALAVPVTLALLAPSFTPLPGGIAANSAAVTALVTTVAMGACTLTFRTPAPWRPGVLPGLAVAVAALAMLPLASEVMRDKYADQRSLAQVQDFQYRIAVLDHRGWSPVRVHEVREGLRVTYVRGGEDSGGVHVISWSSEQNRRGVLADCDFTGVECLEESGLVWVHRGAREPRRGAPAEVRARLSDGAIASVQPLGTTGERDLRIVAEALRLEYPDERRDLAQTIVRE
ncbi:hypothetical protein [Nocardiopsis sp. MG754419]|uniref:hypothetical protein n=1 Tax=Nocardiopsis sp. MG754419 TaxID=2259865 RepID=UPI001BAA320E|nr:hypothetical protein [Nocardiopsis sp. MG754419]MBR8740468.1 hypothetical protein [Nocardiopsis sp. MG754419]